MHWANDWVGIPHQKLGRGPDSYDCLGFFLELQKVRHGRVIPDPQCSMAQAIQQEVVENLRPHVTKVNPADAMEGDALLFFAGGRPLHVGYALDQHLMLHNPTHASLIETWTGPSWLGKLEGVYRFA